MQITIGSGNNRTTTVLPSGRSFKALEGSRKKAIVDTICYYAGIKG